MTQQIVLSEPELELMLELLQSQQKELLIEIRHTDSAHFRTALKKRFEIVESLIRELQAGQHSERVKVSA